MREGKQKIPKTLRRPNTQRPNNKQKLIWFCLCWERRGVKCDADQHSSRLALMQSVCPLQSCLMACHHKRNKGSANQAREKGAFSFTLELWGAAGWRQDFSSYKHPTQYSVYRNSLNPPFSQPESIWESQNHRENWLNLKTERNTMKWRGFSQNAVLTSHMTCSLQAYVLPGFMEDKQLGMGVSCLCMNRCSINHAGANNKSYPSQCPTPHSPAKKRAGEKPADKWDTLTAKATILLFLHSFRTLTFKSQQQ